MREYMGMRFYASRLVPPDRMVLFHGATTHAIINGLPEAETRLAWDFWRALNPRLDELDEAAAAAWEARR